MAKWIERVLICFLGMIIGIGLSFGLFYKEIWLLGIEKDQKEIRLSIQDLKKMQPQLETTLIRLEYIYKQIEDDWQRILEWKKKESLIMPKDVIGSGDEK